jgi:NAD-dependent deacetylase
MGMRIVILTGAGISAESGLKTFRDSGGLWEGHNVSDVATPAAFLRNPALVQRFYDERRQQLGTVQPNAAHEALARLEARFGDELLLVTQNVDDLHERAGSKNLLHMHGELLSALCLTCGERHGWQGTLADGPACPACGRATLRPDIVWFGEMPYHMDMIEAVLDSCDVFAAIGTSGQVYPAAGFVGVAAAAGARTIEFNLAATAPLFTEHREGPATVTVPEWVDSLLGA